MGKVWRARHTTLKRDDALKVLPEAVAADPERLARFEREAQVLASLNHPNIAHVYGHEDAGGTKALVMELVEGPTLADQIAAGPVPIDETLSIARQIVHALEAAHDRGIVHRDLKPANIKVRSDGTVKVLDFGLAKAVDRVGGASRVSRSPTISTPAVTGHGVILGTAAYMSPEQATGGHVDQRSDIWSFGVVLYEMLTGQRAFPGDSVGRVLAKVIERDPDFSALPAATPPPLRRLLERCLEKDPRRRLHHMGDAGLEIDDSLLGEESEPRRSPPAGHRPVLWALGGLIVGLAAMQAISVLRESPPEMPGPIVRSIVATLPAASVDATRFQGVAISADGRRIVYGVDGALHLRSLDQVDSLPLRGAENGLWPAFSPDGESVAFFVPSESAIKRVSIRGGAATLVTTTDGGRPRGLSWGPDGSIVFATERSAGLWRVRSEGGDAERLTSVTDDKTIGHFWPFALPNGRGVLFNTFRGGSGGVGVVSLETRAVTDLVSVGNHPRFVSTGHLLYTDGDALRAVGFDPARLVRTSDNHVTVVDSVHIVGGQAAFAVASNGSFVHIPGSSPVVQSRLVWVDRGGREQPLDLPKRLYRSVRMSPDGSRIVTAIGNSELWVSDLRRPALSRIAIDPTAGHWGPMWSPDGRGVVFASFPFQPGAPGLFRTAADGTGESESMLTIAGNPFIWPEAWARDGQWLLFNYRNTHAQDSRIGLLSLDARADVPPTWKELIVRSGGAAVPSVSPGGEWVAYQSAGSGRFEVYVERFPDLGERQLISTDPGGTNPVWSANGRELFYTRLGDGAMMTVRIQASRPLTVGAPELLFENQSYAAASGARAWDVDRNGRFLMVKNDTPMPASGSHDLVLVQNWFEELTRLVPAK